MNGTLLADDGTEPAVRALETTIELATTLTLTAPIAARRTIDARGRSCPGPLLELIQAIRESEVGDALALLSADSGSRSDIPRWVRRAGHRLIGATQGAGHNEIVVEKLR